MNLDPTAKALITIGTLLIIAGICWHFGLIQNLKLGRLPGDIAIEKENMKIYIPITTGILISVILSLISWLLK